jgi:hypothetical protein
VSGWKLTVRNGPEVSHEKFADLDEAVAALRARALAIRSQASPKTAALLRTYKPEDQVQARLQLTGSGLLRKPVAGIDVRGDGELVPFRGGGPRADRSGPRPDAVRRGARDSGAAMSEATEIPKGSYAAGERVKLPRGAEPPFTVFINGVEQSEGRDYELEGAEIAFTRPIVKEKVGTGRWLAMYLGLWGTYRKNETVDLQFTRDGKVELLSDLAIVPYPDADAA